MLFYADSFMKVVLRPLCFNFLHCFFRLYLLCLTYSVLCALCIRTIRCATPQFYK